MEQQQTFNRKLSFLVSVALGVSGLIFGPDAMASGAVTTQANMQAQHAAINNLTTDLGIFEYAAQKWAVDNLSNLPWNESGSTTPITYKPRLVYDGNPSLCYGSQGLTSTNLGASPVNLAQQETQNGNSFLPASFQAPYAGAYCAVIVPNTTSTTLNGEIIPVAGVQSIFVPGNTISRDPLLKNNAPSLFAAVHGTQGNTQYHVQYGTAIMQQIANGQNASTGSSFSWAGMVPGSGSGIAASFMTKPLSAMGVMSTSQAVTSSG